MNPFAFGLLAAAALFISQRSHASTIPITGPDTVEYKKFAEVGRWQPLTGPTPGGGGVVFRSPGATDVQPKISNLRLEQAGKAVDVVADVKVPLGTTGKAADVIAKTRITGAMYARGIGAIVGGPLGFSLLAAPLIMSWIDSTGDHRVNPETGAIEKAVSSSGLEYNIVGDTWYSSPGGACSAFISHLNATLTPGWFAAFNSPLCGAEHPNGSAAYSPYNTREAPSSSEWIPSNMESVASRMDEPDAPPLNPETLRQGVSRGVNPWASLPNGPAVTVSGPARVPGGKTTTSSPVRLNEGTTTEAPAGTSNPTQPGTKTTTTTTNHNITYNDNKLTYNTVTNNVTNITNNVTNQTENTDGDETVQEGESPSEQEEEEQTPSDTDLPPVPKLYERKYPDGITGIWNQKSELIKQSSLFTVADQLMPTGLTAGACPSFQIPLDLASWAAYGSHDFAPPCWIWDVAKTIIIISALMLARSLIFGG